MFVSSGLDDSRNTALLAWKMIRDGCLMKITRSLNKVGGTNSFILSWQISEVIVGSLKHRHHECNNLCQSMMAFFFFSHIMCTKEILNAQLLKLLDLFVES